MKILQVSHRVPYPLNEGGTIGIYNYTKGFHELGHSVTLVTLNAKKHSIDKKAAYTELSKYAKVHIVDINTNLSPLAAFINLFSKKSYNASRFYSKEFKNLLEVILRIESFDIIQVEGTFVAMYHEVLRNNSKAPLVLRQHNVEYQIWQRLASNEKNRVKRWYLSLLAKRLKNFEKGVINHFDALVPVTKFDGQLFEQLGFNRPIFVSPAGINTQYWHPSTSENPFHIFHLGSLEWMPNVEAVFWFIDNVWPLILSLDKRFKLYIAGKNMPDYMAKMQLENVIMMGEIEDAYSFVSDKAITVVPLLSGSGIRLKILESMAASKLVISTSIGAQGIDYVDGEHLLIADTPQQFEKYFKALSANPDHYNTVRDNGLKLIKNQYANQAVLNSLLEFYLAIKSK